MKPELFTDYIEWAVGPVRAAGWRKDRMREELAGHLAASWEQERSRDGDDTAAAERALRRMGESGELSRRLQDAVPRLERWLFTPMRFMSWIDAIDRILSPRKGETPLHHAVRVTIGLTAAIALAELIVVPLAMATNARPRTDWATTLLWAIASLAVNGVGGIAFTLMGSAMARAIEDGRAGRKRLFRYCALSSLLAVGLGVGFALIVSLAPGHGFPFARSDGLRLLAASLFAPPMLAFAARESVARRRRRDSWDLADIAS